MSTTQVSVTDLNRVVSAIAATQAAVQQITARTNQISNQVEAVDHRVAAVNRDLVALAQDFVAFVKEQRNANNFQRALTEIVRVRQELEQKFGKHAEARKRLQGILDTVDTGLLREFTIASCSEQIMLDTPKYWLSPCLVALAAWISNDKNLADRAVKVALDRDAEKTALLLALICRRTVPADPELLNQERKADGMKPLSNDEYAEIDRVRNDRQIACFNWLADYFICQNPMKLKESVIVLIDSWANNIFGEDTQHVCDDTFERWMRIVRAGGIDIYDYKDETEKKNKEIAAEAATKEFEANQVDFWHRFFNLFHANKTTKGTYPILAEVSPEFPAANEYLIRINEADNIKIFFMTILMEQVEKSDLIDRLDEQLESLINEFDPEEEGLRKEEEHYELVKQFEGDNDQVVVEEQKRARAKVSAEASLADRLSAVLRVYKPEDRKKYAAARKTALKENFLGKYINQAYTDYVVAKKASFPKDITLKHASWKGWTGKSVDGRNGDELTKSYTDHMNKCRDQELAAVPTNKVKTNVILAIILAIVGVICFVISQPVIGVIGLILAVIFVIMAVKANNDIKAAKEKIVALYKDLIEVGIKTITAALAQWVNVLNAVSEFQSFEYNQILDLTGMAEFIAEEQAEEEAKKALKEAEEKEAEAQQASANTAAYAGLFKIASGTPDAASSGMAGLAALAGGAAPAEDEAPAAEQLAQPEEPKPQVSINQSAEFLQQFASNFSTAFVLTKPTMPNGKPYDIVKAKAMQDAKATKK